MGRFAYKPTPPKAYTLGVDRFSEDTAIEALYSFGFEVTIQMKNSKGDIKSTFNLIINLLYTIFFLFFQENREGQSKIEYFKKNV